MSFLILKIPPENIRAANIAIIVWVVMIFFIYLITKPKKEKKKESVALWEGFESNPAIPIEDDFAQYVKHCAKEADVTKEGLLKYLVTNKPLLLSTYQEVSKRHLEYVRDLSDIFMKIQASY